MLGVKKMRVSKGLAWSACLLLFVLAQSTSVSAAGTGLLGEYYDNKDLTVFKATRIDPTINFSWGLKSPDPVVGTDTFSVRWTGQVEARFSEIYKFYTFTDDGVRLWINGQLIINQWIDQKKENSGSITLVAGQRYNIKMEFYENGSGATAQLSWSSPSQSKQIIPQSQLYATAGTTPPPPPGSSFSWQSATPESQGINRSKLEIMVNVLASRSTKGLMIIRNDRVVSEWYASGSSATQRLGVASAAKGLAGGMALLVALNDGRIGTEDLGSKYIARWRTDSMKSKIRIKHLAAHTSGVEDADGPEPWKQAFWNRIPDPFSVAINQAPVLFSPGSNLAYSNPGIAALDYALTASLKGTAQSDILTILQKRIMEPIGIPASEWSIGYGKAYSLDGLKLYATWGGASYTARAMARVGRLMLRKGNWEGRQLVGSAWATRMVAQVDARFGSGLCWFNNAVSDWSALPRDAYATAGSGHNVLLVVPSLNLIVVRLGSRLMDDTDFWLGLEEYLFEPLMGSLTGS
jgi:CubicO group peptidase (beta-lactamase class C family)